MAGWWRSYIAQRARQMGLDPRAVLAVAAQEGLNSRGGWSGRQGDNGTSFGPFQLHRGGALPAGRSQQWAESRQGIDYALEQINRVAHGERGRQAVSDIVSRFERPANPGGEIARALAAYGGGGAAPAAGPTASLTRSLQAPGQQAGAASPDLSGLRSGLAQSLIAASQQSSAGRRPDYTSVTQALLALHQGQMSPGQPTQAVQPSAPGLVSPPSPAAARTPGVGPPTGGPSLSFLTPLAREFGLQITSTTGGKHAPGSYHYQSRAEDYGGDPAHEARLQRYALAHPREFSEAFYTGPGAAPYFVKNGRVYPISQLDPAIARDHRDHVHLAR